MITGHSDSIGLSAISKLDDRQPMADRDGIESALKNTFKKMQSDGRQFYDLGTCKAVTTAGGTPKDSMTTCPICSRPEYISLL
jgi:hypothetical protein